MTPFSIIYEVSSKQIIKISTASVSLAVFYQLKLWKSLAFNYRALKTQMKEIDIANLSEYDGK